MEPFLRAALLSVMQTHESEYFGQLRSNARDLVVAFYGLPAVQK
jgi:hypothetical protein